MRLHATQAWSLMQTQGFVPATQAAWTRVLELSEKQGDADYQLRALWGLWAGPAEQKRVPRRAGARGTVF